MMQIKRKQDQCSCLSSCRSFVAAHVYSPGPHYLKMTCNGNGSCKKGCCSICSAKCPHACFNICPGKKKPGWKAWKKNQSGSVGASTLSSATSARKTSQCTTSAGAIHGATLGDLPSDGSFTAKESRTAPSSRGISWSNCRQEQKQDLQSRSELGVIDGKKDNPMYEKAAAYDTNEGKK
eukprot:10098013-Ditylum_brightwellii.AAC.1